MHEHGWLGEREFLIAVAIGMISPGPVVITATFVGYLVAGFWGALTATIGIFLPSFLLGAVKPISHRLNEVYIMKKNTILALFTPCCGGDPC
jgi:chromate transport protein ChrA